VLAPMRKRFIMGRPDTVPVSDAAYMVSASARKGD